MAPTLGLHNQQLRGLCNNDTAKSKNNHKNNHNYSDGEENEANDEKPATENKARATKD